MKKILSLLFIVLLIACQEDPEIKKTNGLIKDQDISARTAILPCEVPYKWYHDGTTSNNYLVNGYYNGETWNVILKPKWNAGGGNIVYFPWLTNVVWKIRMQNNGGETFRYRIDGGSWVTLTSGQNGTLIIKTVYGHTPCDNNFPIGPLAFTIDLERLTCGNSPYTMTYSLNIISISNGHNYGVPGGAINQPIFAGTWSAAPGSCHI